MLDIKLIRDDADSIKERVKSRGGDAHLLFDKLLAYDEVRRRCETEKQRDLLLNIPNTPHPDCP
ncbi:MAG: hypothetical protein ACR2RV_00335, partial [Verrucomicrobiales bacterium]